MFHNCGIPLLALRYDDYESVLVEANQQGQNSLRFEDEKYQTNHAVLGYFIASSWLLPKDICKLIAQHHDLDFLKVKNSLNNHHIFAILKAAENLVEKMKRFNAAPDWQYIQYDVLTLLKLSELDYQNLEESYFELLQ